MAMVIENFLPTAMQDEIESVLLGPQFPWYYNPNTNHVDMDTQSDDVPQFVHGFMRDEGEGTPWRTIPIALMEKIGVPQQAILRAKANLLARETKAIRHPAHIDDERPHTVFIYYVNDADGDTCLMDGETVTRRIKPRKGRGLIFDGATFHASSSPISSRFRAVINYNLISAVSMDGFRRFEVEA